MTSARLQKFSRKSCVILTSNVQVCKFKMNRVRQSQLFLTLAALAIPPPPAHNARAFLGGSTPSLLEDTIMWTVLLILGRVAVLGALFYVARDSVRVEKAELAAPAAVAERAAVDITKTDGQLAKDLTPPVKLQAGGKPIDVDVGHAAPFVADWNGDGTMHLLVGQFGDGKLRIYKNVGSKTEPRFGNFTWFSDEAKGGRVPTG